MSFRVYEYHFISYLCNLHVVHITLMTTYLGKGVAGTGIRGLGIFK